MKKYLKMTFTVLSAIALNFSCLAMDSQQSDAPRYQHSETGVSENIYYQPLTPLSTEEQISLLRNAITASDVFLVEAIFAGCVEKIAKKYYYTTRKGTSPFTVSSKDLEDLQQLALEDLQRLTFEAISCCGQKNKWGIFKLITFEFFKVAENKEYVCQTTASGIYNYDLDLNEDRFVELVNLFPSLNSKRAFVRQLLNEAKQNHYIECYEEIFLALDPTRSNIPLPSFSAFKNQDWLQPFISEYLEQAQLNAGLDMPTILYFIKETTFSPYLEYLEQTDRSGCFDIPLYFIKEVAPDLYNKNFLALLEKCIMEDSQYSIDILLPRDKDNLPSDNRRLSSEYLNLALESFNTHFHKNNSGSKHILSNIASYTDTSSDLTNIALTLTSFIQEKRQETLECIKDANSGLHNLILEKLQSLEY